MSYQTEWAASFRDLTPEELARTTRAMRYLYAKGINPQRIADLHRGQLDREAKTATFHYEHKSITVCRTINYANSPLELQIEAMPELKTSYRVFPKKVWGKRKTDVFSVPRFTEAEIRQLLGLPQRKNHKPPLIFSRKRLIINLSI